MFKDKLKAITLFYSDCTFLETNLDNIGRNSIPLLLQKKNLTQDSKSCQKFLIFLQSTQLEVFLRYITQNQ